MLHAPHHRYTIAGAAAEYSWGCMPHMLHAHDHKLAVAGVAPDYSNLELLMSEWSHGVEEAGGDRTVTLPLYMLEGDKGNPWRLNATMRTAMFQRKTLVYAICRRMGGFDSNGDRTQPPMSQAEAIENVECLARRLGASSTKPCERVSNSVLQKHINDKEIKASEFEKRWGVPSPTGLPLAE
jgi:hypothetical protein